MDHAAALRPERGKDRPTIDRVEQDLWDALSGNAPAGQAAIGVYKLDRIAERLDGESLSSASVLMSVSHADPELEARYRRRIPVFVIGDVESELVTSGRQVREFLEQAAPSP